MSADPSPNEPPTLCITGEKVGLGPIRRGDLPLFQRWMNDWTVTRTLGRTSRPYTFEAETTWYESAIAAENEVHFTIFELSTLRPIGTTALVDIDLRQRTAELGIMIGERSCWGLGYGTEACKLVLDYGFTVLDLHNIMLSAFAFNRRGIAAYRRAGFREIGRRREAVRIAGRAYDLVYMDCLATEFESPVLRSVFQPETP